MHADHVAQVHLHCLYKYTTYYNRLSHSVHRPRSISSSTLPVHVHTTYYYRVSCSVRSPCSTSSSTMPVQVYNVLQHTYVPKALPSILNQHNCSTQHGIGSHLHPGKPSRYVINYLGQLSLAIPSLVGAVGTSNSLGTISITTVSECKLVSG